jgi:succinate dehydrogenase hydrophobic anchor subunit
MRLGDWLIVSGVVLVPFAIFLYFGIAALAAGIGGDHSDLVRSAIWAVMSIASLVIAVAAGLIATGILLRKNK